MNTSNDNVYHNVSMALSSACREFIVRSVVRANPSMQGLNIDEIFQAMDDDDAFSWFTERYWESRAEGGFVGTVLLPTSIAQPWSQLSYSN